MTEHKMKVEINKYVCIGCGICTQIAPEVFVINFLEVSEVKNYETSDKNVEKIFRCANFCPVEAISIE
jgi:ferredoxin